MRRGVVVVVVRVGRERVSPAQTWYGNGATSWAFLRYTTAVSTSLPGGVTGRVCDELGGTARASTGFRERRGNVLVLYEEEGTSACHVGEQDESVRSEMLVGFGY